jgi:hypothetical protein
MAGRPRFEEIFPAADLGADFEAPDGRNSDGTCPGSPPVAHGTNTAIENWLLHHLRQLYDEVCSEPLPNELSEMIDRFRRRRQDTEAGRDNVGPLTPTARQGS